MREVERRRGEGVEGGGGVWGLDAEVEVEVEVEWVDGWVNFRMGGYSAYLGEKRAHT